MGSTVPAWDLGLHMVTHLLSGPRMPITREVGSTALLARADLREMVTGWSRVVPEARRLTSVDDGKPL